MITVDDIYIISYYVCDFLHNVESDTNFWITSVSIHELSVKYNY